MEQTQHDVEDENSFFGVLHSPKGSENSGRDEYHKVCVFFQYKILGSEALMDLYGVRLEVFLSVIFGLDMQGKEETNY